MVNPGARIHPRLIQSTMLSVHEKILGHVTVWHARGPGRWTCHCHSKVVGLNLETLFGLTTGRLHVQILTWEWEVQSTIGHPHTKNDSYIHQMTCQLGRWTCYQWVAELNLGGGVNRAFSLGR